MVLTHHDTCYIIYYLCVYSFLALETNCPVALVVVVAEAQQQELTVMRQGESVLRL